MAREYGRVHTAFWNSRAIRACSDRGKLMASYLLTGPHSNSIGAYLLPDAYIADDMGWASGAVTAALKELATAGFCQRFADGRHIVICKFLVWNPIENPNVGKAALRQLEQLPKDPAIQHVLDGLRGCEKQFPNGLETVLERFRNIETKPCTEPKHETKPEMDSARSADADVIDAFEAFNSVAKELGWPEAQALTNKRKAALRARLAEAGGLHGWLAAMAKARASPFLRGESGRDKEHAGWSPDLDFFLQQTSFTKLMEGKYDQRGRVQSTGFDALREGASRAAGVDGKRGEGVEAPVDHLQRLAISGRS